jgi:multidrug efflux pump
VQARILAALHRLEFEQVQRRVSPLELGPPVGWPLKFRISGPDPLRVREIAQNFASLLGKTPHARNITFDWNEPSKVVRVEVDQDRARALGISSQALSQTINAVLSGTTVTQLRDDIYLIDIVARAVPDERAKLETLRSLMINVPGGRPVPLEQVAKLSYGIEPPLVWRRHRLPTVTVQADTAQGLEAATVVKALSPDLAAFKSTLPAGYDVVAGGTVEESAKAETSIFAVFPLMILIMITILMVQLQSFQRLFLVLATAPLALIGVAAALLVFRAPMGFVAILGVFSLIGMVIRNFGHSDRPDRYRNSQRPASLERRDNSYGAPAAPDPPDRRRRHSRHDSDRAHSVLGSDGLRRHGWPCRRDAAHACLPAGALRCMVSHPARGRHECVVGRIARWLER